MKGGQIKNGMQQRKFKNIKLRNNVSSDAINVYVCSSSSIAIQLQMIENEHTNVLHRPNSRNINPENNLIYMGVLKKLKQRGNSNQYDITTMLDGQEKYLFATNEQNFYASFGSLNNKLIIDVNPLSSGITTEIESAIRGLFGSTSNR